MHFNGSGVTLIIKDPQCWRIEFDLKETIVFVEGWQSSRWNLMNLHFPKSTEELSNALYSLDLLLFRDERTDYRFNLSSRNPLLFFVFEICEDESIRPFEITASQTCAARFMDGDYFLISNKMPLPVQAWMEAFIGRHGELLDIGKKKRKGAGRSNGR